MTAIATFYVTNHSFKPLSPLLFEKIRIFLYASCNFVLNSGFFIVMIFSFHLTAQIKLKALYCPHDERENLEADKQKVWYSLKSIFDKLTIWHYYIY